MDNIDPLHLYSSLIFQSISVSVWGWMLCPQNVFRNTTCILCILIYPPGKSEREEPFILPPSSGMKVRYVIMEGLVRELLPKAVCLGC